MTIIRDFPYILHGGDWNPDQWLRHPEVIDRDFELMDRAGCNTFSLGIFSWGQIELEEGVFDFSWLDSIMDRCAERGKKIFLATPSAARPGWMGQRYPETAIVQENGRRLPWMTRQSACLNSPVYRNGCARIDGLLAERYHNHPALAGWHVSNEYSTVCWCDRCLEKFHEYLKRRYRTLDHLNDCYWSAFWSHRFTDWAQVNPGDGALDIARLDWMRFVSENILDFFRMEIAAIRRYSDKPLSTNMMGTFGPLNYWTIAGECDFIGDDCYPDWYLGDVEREAARFSFLHDMHYTMKNKPFLLFETCPGIPNYHPYTKLRRPNELVREMHLALGHGADGTMYFQWRKGRGNAEKIHGAVVGHDGTDQTLMFRTVAEYGARLPRIAEIVDSGRRQQAAVVFDWEALWALNTTCGFGGDSVKQYERTVGEHYRALWKHNVDLAVINSTGDFSGYRLLVAPMLFLLKDGVAERLKSFVQNGGTLVMTYLSAYVDENNACFFGGNPGGKMLRELFGIWSEDIDGLEPQVRQSFDYRGVRREVRDYAEYLHAEGAEVLASYNSEFYAGSPALTVNRFGLGQAFYIGARTGLEFLTDFYGELLESCGISPVLPGVPEALAASRRIGRDGSEYYFLLNLTPEEQRWPLPFPMEDLWNGKGEIAELLLPPSGSTVLKRKAEGAPAV